MSRLRAGLLALVLGAGVAAGESPHDAHNAPKALITLSEAPWLQVGVEYARLNKRVEVGGAEWKLRGDVVDVMLGVSPVPWLLLYAQAGGSEARIDGAMVHEPSAGAGGLVGASVNLWQYDEGVQRTAWRFTVQAAGQVAWRTTSDNGSGKLEWAEAQVMLPLNYHLVFARSNRHTFLGEFHSLSGFAGPALSRIDGRWKRDGLKQDIREAESFGVAGGGDLWLTESLAFGARFEWFEGVSARLNVRYLF